MHLQQSPALPRFFAPLLGVLLLAGAAVTALRTESASAWDTCLHPSGYCGSHHYSSVQIADGTGWTGAKATAITNSIYQWDSSYIDVTKTATCPCTADIALSAGGLGYAPGWNINSYNPSDAYQITYSQNLLNSSYTWYTDGTMNVPNGQVDVRTIITHEMGHMLGLDHSCSYSGAVMCVSYYVSKWYPSYDEWAGIDAMY